MTKPILIVTTREEGESFLRRMKERGFLEQSFEQADGGTLVRFDMDGYLGEHSVTLYDKEAYIGVAI